MRLLPFVSSFLVLTSPAAALDVGETAPVASAAHELGQSYIFFRVYEDSIIVRLEITAPDIERALEFGWDPDQITQAQVNASLDSILAYVNPRLSITTDRPLPLRFRNAQIHFLEVADYVVLNYAIEGQGQTPDSVAVLYSVMFDFDDDHRNFLAIEHNWKTGTFNSEAIALIFTPRSPEQTLDLTSSSLLRGLIGMIRLGVWHIWIGIDHILFLMALILPSVLVRKDGQWIPAPKFRTALIKIATIVTFFTIAHSVTLSLAALDLVRIPSRLVESVIAGSIAVAAGANLVPRLRIPEAAIAFVFGLFHGFGFASVLAGIGIGREHLVLSLLGFNVGVELGQLGIVIVVFPVLYVLRTSKAYLSILKYSSLLLIAIAAYWVLERGFAVDIPLGRWARRLVGR